MNWAYLLRCADGTLYAGWTNNLQKRLDMHNSGKGAKYTRCRLPVSIALAEQYETQSLAMSREAELKRMSKSKKELLVKQYLQANS